jgi:N6-L-threonylcarbamoyladenine synthase
MKENYVTNKYKADQPLILSIESSCDETAAAVLYGEREVRADIVASQVKLHSEYGGVVPELACRAHTEAVAPVVERALNEAGATLDDLDAIAVTRGPGLVGALLVGLSFAKGLAWSRDIPLVGVHHLKAHLAAANIEFEIEGPYVGLVVSGGHTALYHTQNGADFRLLGQTVDDAAGEAFDKVAKVMGLGYPGGVVIDRLAKEGDPACFKFPRPMLHKGGLDFSFSGLKTALRLHVEKYTGEMTPQEVADTCASFQEAAVDTLVTKTMRALKETGATQLVVCGGVACNSRLRAKMAEAMDKRGHKLMIPSPRLCTDNAVMVAAAGRRSFLEGVRDTMELNAVPTWPLDQ